MLKRDSWYQRRLRSFLLLLLPLSSLTPTMEAVCLKCGDVGFIEAIVFCNKCQACALHRYCLDGPVIFTDDVIWFCEDCEPKAVVSYSLDQSTLLASKKTNSSNLANNAILSQRKLDYCVKRVKKSKQQNTKKNEEKQKNGKVSSVLVAETKVLLSDSRCSPELEHPQCNISHEQENKSKNGCGTVPTDAENSNVGLKPVQISQVTATDDLITSNIPVDAQPISDPIWRGDLLFCNKTIGLLAHLSSLASPKVREETELFPEVLSADLPPRSAVWPNSFKKEGPTDKSIALYFFPKDKRLAIKAFDMLVDDIIRTEAAIRVVTENAMLLMFPSTLLPIQHQKFQTKYYLWGVFKKSKLQK
ncbi:RING/FYVE/PHD zinc finger superfamily protein [Trifolium repens]|nr:RING/FYVE/PHD zinc finger superfamily protein [Trifolium repens]